MGNSQIKKKIKSQKIAAIFLIFTPLLLILSFLTKNDFAINNRNGYIMIGSLVVLIIIGSIGLKNSLRKEKNFINNKAVTDEEIQVIKENRV